MAKKSGRKLSKKGLAGLHRITNNNKERVFLYRGEEFKTLMKVREKYPMR